MALPVPVVVLNPANESFLCDSADMAFDGAALLSCQQRTEVKEGDAVQICIALLYSI